VVMINGSSLSHILHLIKRSKSDKKALDIYRFSYHHVSASVLKTKVHMKCILITLMWVSVEWV